jgi:hypothetical protein
LNCKIQYILIYLLSGFIPLLLSQSTNPSTIKGTVLDSLSGESIHLVNVYLAGTTFGSSTTQTGDYIIENIPAGYYKLIFQHVGYDLKVINIQLNPDEIYFIDEQLKPIIYDSEEIQISTTEPEEWKNQLEFFIKEFIGKSENAEDCEILNPEVLNFEYNDESNEFIALTDSIIRIENRNLGYRMDILLVDFKCKNEYLARYLIYPKFNQLETSDDDEMEMWLENRRITYKASLKHFLSTIARGMLIEENFNMLKSDNLNWLMKGRGKYVDDNSLRISDTRTPLYKRFHLNDFLMVSFSPEKLHPPSIIYLKQDYIIIDTLGNIITPEYIEIAGEWYNKRVADLLPMDYFPTN